MSPHGNPHHCVFRDFGFGKSSMEELIHEEILYFHQQLDRELDQPVDLKHKFNISVINGLMSIMTGKRYELVSKIEAPFIMKRA